MDMLDFLTPRTNETKTGRFFEDRPEMNGGGVEIHYEEVSPLSQSCIKVFGNVYGATGDLTIRTSADLTIDSRNLSEYITVHKVMQKARIQTQDGRLFIVDKVVRETQDNVKNNCLAFTIPVGQTYLLSLKQINTGAEWLG